MPDTTQEVRIPLHIRLRLHATTLAAVAAQIERLVRDIPAGNVATALAEIGKRTLVDAEALAERAAEIEEHWPREARNA
jgi:hypothetical protein